MSISYHELTHGQPKNPKAERQQFLILSIIGIAFLLHSAISAGILAPLPITQDVFPGGEFVYKLMTNDYIASYGSIRTISEDLGIDKNGLDAVEFLYTLYLDDAALVPGGMTRFASGALLKGEKETKSRLLAVNRSIPEKSEGKMSKDTRYEVAMLPKVNAAVVDHPFTAGAWSTLLLSYKIIPAFKKYAKEHTKNEESPVVISTCSEKQSMCTFYMPLSQGGKFFVGKKTAEEYAQEFDENVGFLKRMGVDIEIGFFLGVDWSNVWRGAKKALGLSVSSKKRTDEL